MSATRVTRRTTDSESAQQIHASSPSPAGAEPTPLDILANAAVSGQRTRSGRVSKPPVRYEPVEQVEDDYDADDYDTEDPDDVSEEIETESDEEEDADENSEVDIRRQELDQALRMGTSCFGAFLGGEDRQSHQSKQQQGA